MAFRILFKLLVPQRLDFVTRQSRKLENQLLTFWDDIVFKVWPTGSKPCCTTDLRGEEACQCSYGPDWNSIITIIVIMSSIYHQSINHLSDSTLDGNTRLEQVCDMQPDKSLYLTFYLYHQPVLCWMEYAYCPRSITVIKPLRNVRQVIVDFRWSQSWVCVENLHLNLC